MCQSMFNELQEINSRPRPFQFYTAKDLWTDEHTSKKMLEYHLNESVDLASRKPDFINRSVAWIADHFCLHGQTSLLDFGCGPGLYTNKLAKKGCKVTGVDFSKRSLEYAQQTATQGGLDVHYVHQNYLGFESNEKHDLITMIWCDFCALSPAQRKTMLRKFRDLLKPGGHVLLDVHAMHAFHERKEMATYEFNHMNNFWSPEDHYCFINTFKYNNEKVILDKYTIIEKNRTRVVYNWLQYFNEGALKKELEANGLVLEALYSDVSGKEYHPGFTEFAVVAGRNGN